MQKTSPDIMISCHDISVTLDGNIILDHISFDITKGSITSLLGISGSGKSTLLRYMAGLVCGSSGEMHLRGEVTNNKDIILINSAKRNIAYMFQDYALFPHKTILENVLFADKSDTTKQDKKIEALEILKEVGLNHYQDRYPHHLSGGEKQRLALARCLMQKTDLVFLDEPFSNLDARLRDYLRDEILGLLHQKGKTIIMVTHDPAEAMLVSDQIIYMRESKIIQSATPQELYLAPYDYLTALFFGAINQIQGKVTRHGLETDLGTFPIQDVTAQNAILCLRYETFEIASKENASLHGILQSMSFSGAYYICDILIESVTVTALLPMSALSGYKIGREIHLNIKPEGLFVFPVNE